MIGLGSSGKPLGMGYDVELGMHSGAFGTRTLGIGLDQTNFSSRSSAQSFSVSDNQWKEAALKVSISMFLFNSGY